MVFIGALNAIEPLGLPWIPKGSTGGRNQAPAWAKPSRVNPFAVRDESRPIRIGRHIPKTPETIATACQNMASVTTELHEPGRMIVSKQRCSHRASRRVPNAHGLVHACRREPPAI